MTDTPLGIVDNAAAMPYIIAAYGVMAFLLVGLLGQTYSALRSSSRQVEDLKSHNKTGKDQRTEPKK